MLTDIELAREMIRPHAHGRDITDPDVHREMAGTCGGGFDGIYWEAKKNGLHWWGRDDTEHVIQWKSLSQPSLFEAES